MKSFPQFCHRHLPTRLHARRLCQGSTIILGMCVLVGAASAITLLIVRLAPGV